MDDKTEIQKDEIIPKITQLGRDRAGNISGLSEARTYALSLQVPLQPLSFLFVPSLRKHRYHLGESGHGCDEATVSVFLASLIF